MHGVNLPSTTATFEFKFLDRGGHSRACPRLRASRRGHQLPCVSDSHPCQVDCFLMGMLFIASEKKRTSDRQRRCCVFEKGGLEGFLPQTPSFTTQHLEDVSGVVCSFSLECSFLPVLHSESFPREVHPYGEGNEVPQTKRREHSVSILGRVRDRCAPRLGIWVRRGPWAVEWGCDMDGA